MPSRDVNAATQLAEASWRRDKIPRWYHLIPRWYNLDIEGDITLFQNDTH